MPRNASGTYTLASGNPVAPDTLIEVSWANPTLADIAQALTDSLDRYGRGSMVGSMKFPDGTIAAPSIAFASESSTGFFKPASKVIGVSVNNSETMRLEPDRVTLKSAGADMLVVEPTKVTFTAAPFWATAPTVNEHLTNKAYVDGHVASYVDTKLTTDAPGGGYLPLNGGSLTGNVVINAGDTDSTVELQNTTAPADKQRGLFRIEDTGNIVMGGHYGGVWKRGLEVRANGQLYDIAGAAMVMNTNGGTFTNTVTVNRGTGSGYADLMVTVDAAPATARSATVRHLSNGTTYFGQWDSTKTTLKGGICVSANNDLLDIKSNSKIWHAGNDGNGSGLDADMLEGYHGAFVNSGNTYALRDSVGAITAHSIVSNNTPRIWINFDGITSVARHWLNVTSVTDMGGGRSRINFSISLLNNQYCAIATAGDASSAGYDSITTSMPRWDQRAANRCDIYSYHIVTSGAVNDTEPNDINFMILHYGS